MGFLTEAKYVRNTLKTRAPEQLGRRAGCMRIVLRDAHGPIDREERTHGPHCGLDASTTVACAVHLPTSVAAGGAQRTELNPMPALVMPGCTALAPSLNMSPPSWNVTSGV
jgi:hypothetical protein